MFRKSFLSVIRNVLWAFSLIFFMLVASGVSESLLELIPNLQAGAWFLAAIMGASFSALIFLVILLFSTLVFGRWYCSFLCPLGLCQDIALAFHPKAKLSHHAAWKGRYYFFAVLLTLLIGLGNAEFFGYFEPFTMFMRSASSLRFGGLDFLFMAAVLAAAFFRGRLFCNTLCPVGALLSVPAKDSHFSVRMNGKCVSCRKCVRVCKAECLDVEKKRADSSRCVLCFKCLPECSFSALSYGPPVAPVFSETKRGLLKFSLLTGGLAALFYALPFLPRRVRANEERPMPLPPGAETLSETKSRCTGCRLCEAACPVGIISFPNRFGNPKLNYEKGFCGYECTACLRVCPSNALKKMSTEEKKETKIGEAVLLDDVCVVNALGEACGACAEHCPTGAIVMIKNKGGLPAPVLDKSLCIGCGACHFACPTRPQRAISVKGFTTQTKARQMKNTQKVYDASQEDFAF